jgi:hypothetical protein
MDEEMIGRAAATITKLVDTTTNHRYCGASWVIGTILFDVFDSEFAVRF